MAISNNVHIEPNSSAAQLETENSRSEQMELMAPGLKKVEIRTFTTNAATGDVQTNLDMVEEGLLYDITTPGSHALITAGAVIPSAADPTIATCSGMGAATQILGVFYGSRDLSDRNTNE
jgi:hypothetical protein